MLIQTFNLESRADQLQFRANLLASSNLKFWANQFAGQFKLSIQSGEQIKFSFGPINFQANSNFHFEAASKSLCQDKPLEVFASLLNLCGDFRRQIFGSIQDSWGICGTIHNFEPSSKFPLQLEGWVEDISFTIQYLQGWIYYSRERPGGRCRVPDCVGRVWCLQTLGQPYTLEVVLFAEGFEWSDELCLSRQLQTGNETLWWGDREQAWSQSASVTFLTEYITFWWLRLVTSLLDYTSAVL